jgi:hypothetical protein
MKHKALTTLICLSLSLTMTVAAQDKSAYSSNRAKMLSKGGKIESKSIKFYPLNGTQKSRDVTVADALAVRIHFNVVTPLPSSGWSISIRDRNNLVAWTYTAEHGDEVKELWSNTMKGDKFTVEVTTAQPNNGLKLEIDSLVKVVPEAIPQSAIGDTDFEPITSKGPEVQGWGRAVARIHFKSDDDSQFYFCTGFLVAPDILMTNNHCISTANEAKDAEIWFDYDLDDDSHVEAGVKELLLTSCDNDFALLRLKQPVASPTRIPLQLSAAPLTSQEKLIVIQHPGGGKKQVNITGCSVRGAEIDGNTVVKTDFSHTCDTYKSSSGSPIQVFENGSQHGKVIGIHHLGWNTEILSPSDPMAINRAVRMANILDYIRRNKPELIAQLNIQ